MYLDVTLPPTLQTHILEHLPDAVVVTNAASMICFYNRAAEALYSQKAETLLGAPLMASHRVHWPRPQDAALAQEALAADHTWQGEQIHITTDGRLVPVKTSIFWIKDAVGALTATVYISRDISEQQHNTAALRAAQAETDQQRLLLDALRDTVTVLTKTQDSQRVMKVILENVGRVVRHQAANIALIEGAHLRIAAAHGYPPEHFARIEAVPLPLDIPTMKFMMETGQSLLVEDTRTYVGWVPVEGLEWVRSYMGTPIRVYENIIGFLSLDSDQTHAFTHHDLEHLRVFADHAAVAIENAQLFDAVCHDAARLRALSRATSLLFTPNLFSSDNLRDMSTKIIEAVTEEFGLTECALVMFNTRNQLEPVAQTPGFQLFNFMLLTGSDHPLQQALRSGQLQSMDSGVEAHLGMHELFIPLCTPHAVIGALCLQSTRAKAFDPQEQRMVQAFAERATAALENVRLIQQIRRHNDELETRVHERTEEVKRTKERVEAILNHSSDAILLIRLDGTIQQTNHAFDRLFSYRPDQAFGRSITQVVAPAHIPALCEALQTVAAEKRPVRIEVVVTPEGAAMFSVDMILSPLPGTHDLLSGIVCSLRDISIFKQMERNLREALEKEREFSDSRTQFFARASHEFRTPLSIISTSTELLQRYGDRMTPEQRVEKLERVRTQIQSMNTLMDDLLALSRAQHIQHEQFDPVQMDVGAFCKSFVAYFEEIFGRTHRFSLTCSPQPLNGTLDEQALRRILNNLLSNAVKYSPEGSTVEVTITGEADHIALTVNDSGIGIPEEARKHIFDPFFRAQNVEHLMGTGLGLPIVQQAVQMHGGTIQVTSEVGKGTGFKVILPQPVIERGSS